MSRLEVHRHDDWSALYVDGVLDCTGHDVTERALDLAGVPVVDDDAFLQGGNGSGRHGTPPVAPTLGHISAYRADRDQRRADADKLRESARKLLAQADALDGRKSA